MQNDRSLRIRTAVGEYSPNVVNVKLTQTYDSFEILSLKIDQANTYKLFQSDYGVIVGRVNASGNFGVPNAKVSLFIPVKNNETTLRKIIYGYKNIQTKDADGIRYNLLPNDVINACYQNVGTFPDKRLLLDNKDYLEIFDDYFKYTTVTNASGDYMLFGVPTGQQTLHVDIDLSDIGPLSQRPRDMIYQGFNINQFESPNKFKRSTDLDSLAQIKSQSKGVDVFPFWGDTTSDGGETIGITRCDIQVQYNFQPTAVFMGSVISDNGTKAISKNCVCDSKAGKMNELVTGEGTIEMVRKRFDGRVEEFQIRGNRLINGDGVWCYQIPMNLDYMMTDEFGNMVPTDNPNKGIPTRARVRFRIGMDGLAGDGVGRKRAMYLVPNNPRIDSNNPEFVKKINRGESEIIDYEFGSLTSEESFRDLMWNNVYTVKSYIPRLQASNNPRGEKYTGIKRIRDHGSNNPFPYNNMRVRLSLPYIINCIVVKFIISLVVIWNKLITVVAKILGVKIPVINVRPFAWIGEGWLHCMGLPTEMCQMDDDLKLYYPGCDDRDAKYFNNYWFKEEERKSCNGDPKSTVPCGAKPSYGEGSELINCVENQLAEEYDAVRLLFANDWVNGTMYFPMWHRRIKAKRKYLFGLIKVPGKDDWCSTDGYKSHWWYRKVRPFSNCAMVRGKSLKDKYINEYGKTVIPNYVVKSERSNCVNDCQDKNSYLPEKLNKGLIKKKDSFDGIDVFYYSPIQFTDKLHKNEYAEDLVKRNGELTLLFATDLVLLGSFNECDSSGVSGVFNELTSSSFIIPEGLRSLDGTEPELVLDANGNTIFRKSESEVRTEFSGMDWGLANSFDQYSRTKWKSHGLLRIAEQQSKDGGLFYGIGCTIVETLPKSCLNLSRICEFGVRLDEGNEEIDIERAKENYKNEGYILNKYYSVMAPDGYISFDDIEDFDSRSEFATMNYNGLTTKFDSATNGYKYDFNYLYLNNFDGSMRNTMEDTQSSSEYRTHKVDEGGLISYRFNYLLEDFSRDYYRFRLGKAPYNYDKHNNTFPRYENSLYFYFGLFDGKTALDKFNSDFNSDCRNITEPAFSFKMANMPNSWCEDILRDKTTSGDNRNGVIAFDFDGISTPFKIILSNKKVKDSVIEIDNISLEKFYLMSNTKYTNKYSGDFIKDLHSEGYVHAEAMIPSYNNTGKLKSGVSIPNGLYDVYIVDNEGNVETAVLDFRASYLSYSTDNTRTFIKEYKHILHDFDNDCSRIVKHPETGTNRNIGGYIVIDEFIDGNKDIIRDNLLKDYLIEVESDQALTNCSGLNNYKNENGDNVWRTIIDGGTPDGNSFYFKDTMDNSIKIGIPEAPMSYTVRITELCGDVPSQNSVETTVFIKEPEPVRLFVNGVDHELITGKNWDLITSGTNTGSVLINANTNTNGWFRIQDGASYNWENYPEYNEAITSDKNNQVIKNELIERINDSLEKLNSLSSKFDKIKAELNEKYNKRDNINKEIDSLIIQLNALLSSGSYSESDANRLEAKIDAKEDELSDVEDKIDELLMELSTITSNADSKDGIDTGEEKVDLIDTINSTILQVISILNLSSININALKLYMHEQGIPTSSVIDDYMEKNDLTIYSLLTELIDLIIEDVGSIGGTYNKYEYTKEFEAILKILSNFRPREVEFVKEDIISKMVNGFVFTSFDEVKSLTLSVTGDKQIYPVKYYMKYTRQGSTDEDRFKYVNTHYYISDVVTRNLNKINKGEPNHGTVHLTTENSVDGIGLPNISTTDNIVYRQNLAPNSGLTPNAINGFGIHPLKDYSYVDSDGNTIGSTQNVLIYRYGILAQDDEINLPMSSISNGNLIDKSAGTAIFIDKILRLNMLSWAAFTTEGDGIARLDITQNLEQDTDPNRWIYSVGMFASDITNGVAKQMENKRIFTIQTLDEELFDIIYLNYKPTDYNMEADLIVKGVVTRGVTLDSYKVGKSNVPSKVYKGYRLDSMLKSNGTKYYGSQVFDTDHQFIDLTNESVTNLLIRQYSGSFLNEEIYGNMRLFPGSDVQFDIYADDSVLSKMYSYILPGPKQKSGYKYVSKFNLKSNVDANYDSYLFDWKWDYDVHPIASIKNGRFTYDNVENLFDVDTPIEVIRDRSYEFKIDNIDRNAITISEYNSKHDNSLVISMFSNNEKLFKTIGEANEVPFTRLMHQRAIAVGITENNCRTITPIYDFSPRSVDLYFITLKGETSENNRYFIGFAASDMHSIKVNGEVKDVMIDPRVGAKHVNNKYIQYLPHSVVGTVWLRRDDEVKVGGKNFSFGGGEQLLTPSVPSVGAEYGRTKLSDFAYTEIRLEPVEGEDTKPEEVDGGEDEPVETMGGSYFEHIRKKAKDNTTTVHRLLFEGNASWMAAKNWADNQKVYIIDASGIKVQAFISNIFFKDYTLESDGNVKEEEPTLPDEPSPDEPKPNEPTPSDGMVYLDTSRGELGVQLTHTEHISGTFVIGSEDEKITGNFYTDEEYDYAGAVSWGVKTNISNYKYNTRAHAEGSTFSGTLSLNVDENTSQKPNPTIGLNFDGNTYRNGDTISFTRTNKSRISVSVDIN